MKHLEVKTIEHKGIKVIVEINYDEGKVALVESKIGSFYPKGWVFANRGLEYMKAWLNIIEAMGVAVHQAKKDLEHDLAEKTAFKKPKQFNANELSPRDITKMKRKL